MHSTIEVTLGGIVLAEDDQLIEWLQRFDLSREEAKIYLTLLKYKNLVVSELNSKIDFDKKDASRTYIYSFLRRMEGRWVHVQERRRKSSFYNPYPPREIMTEVLEQKRREQEELEQIFPSLIEKLEKIHQENTWDDIPPVARRYVETFDIKEFFKHEDIRIETYEVNEPDNPYLNLGFGNFSGFHVFRHKHTGTEDFVIGVNQFETEDALTGRKDLMAQVLQFKVEELSREMLRNGVIDMFTPLATDSISLEKHKINRFRFQYRNPKYSPELLEGVYFSFIPNNSPNVFVSIYSNVHADGEQLLRWILKRSQKPSED